MLKILLLSALLILVAVAALAIRIILKPGGEFHGSSCSSSDEKLSEKGIECSCGKAEVCENR
ncbi:MAG: hypothetical protein AMS27_10435 [Bacteroides sp. SM23_62_1]|nr:MAG: hypothetical protein AMS27_10435 [Bacteroides sp. SM23_62_1]